MRRGWGILLLGFVVAGGGNGWGQPLTVAVTAFSGSTGATVVATGPASASVRIESSDSLSLWSVLTTLELDGNGTRQFQDTGASNVSQRYYRVVNLPLFGGGLYSVNLAGVVRMPVSTGWVLLANPLLSTNGTVASGFKSPANGYSLFRLTAAGFEANNYLNGWSSPTMPFGPGQGFFLNNASGVGATLTFFGEVPQGMLTSPIVAGSSLLSSIVPQAGALESTLGFPADYDVVYQ